MDDAIPFPADPLLLALLHSFTPSDPFRINAFCPLIPASLVQRRLQTGKLAMTELGLEMRCSRCKHYWPMDTEFFFSNGGSTQDSLSSWCAGCYRAWKAEYKTRLRPPPIPAPPLPGYLPSARPTAQIAVC